MRKIIFLMAIILSAINCYSINPQYQKFLGLKYRYPCTNFEAGDFKGITGRFNGSQNDTLTLFPYDGSWDSSGEFVYDEWIVISKYGTVPSKIIRSYYPELVYEGDLDGNGCDEYGVLHAFESTWCDYCIYTCYKGKNADFACVPWWLGNEEDLSIIARRGDRRGEVKLSRYEWASDMSEILKKREVKRITKFLK